MCHCSTIYNQRRAYYVPSVRSTAVPFFEGGKTAREDEVNHMHHSKETAFKSPLSLHNSPLHIGVQIVKFYSLFWKIDFNRPRLIWSRTHWIPRIPVPHFLSPWTNDSPLDSVPMYIKLSIINIAILNNHRRNLMLLRFEKKLEKFLLSDKNSRMNILCRI